MWFALINLFSIDEEKMLKKKTKTLLVNRNARNLHFKSISVFFFSVLLFVALPPTQTNLVGVKTMKFAERVNHKPWLLVTASGYCWLKKSESIGKYCLCIIDGGRRVTVFVAWGYTIDCLRLWKWKEKLSFQCHGCCYNQFIQSTTTNISSFIPYLDVCFCSWHCGYFEHSAHHLSSS